MTHLETSTLTFAQADALVEAAESIVPCLQLPLAEAKRMRNKLVELGIPTSLGRDDHCTSGCSPKVLVLAREEDLPRIADVLKQDWVGMLANESDMAPEAMAWFASHASPLHPQVETAEPPCPACGHVGPLTDAQACADCGLVLA